MPLDPALARVTFGRWADEWLATPGKRPSAWARDESILRNHLLPTLESLALGTIKPNDVQALVTGWGAETAPRTVRRQYDTLRAILNAAVAVDLIARSPCRGIRLPAITQTTRHVVGAEELASIASAMGDYAPMAYLGAVLGLGGASAPALGSFGATSSARPRSGRAAHPRPSRRHGAGAAQVTGWAALHGRPSGPHGLLSDHTAWRGITGADPDEFVFRLLRAGTSTTPTFAGGCGSRPPPSPASKASPSTTSDGPTRQAWSSTGSI